MTKANAPLDSAFLDGDNASYDDIAKRFLAHKLLLAQILKEVYKIIFCVCLCEGKIFICS